MQNRGYSQNIELVNIGTVISAVFTFANATSIFTSNGSGLRNGDVVRLSNDGGALPDGLLTTIDYFVKVINANTFYLYLDSGFKTLATADDDGSGTNSYTLQAKKMNVADYRNIILELNTTDSAAVTIKVKGSSSKEAPNFSNAASPTNIWSYVQIKNINNGDSINGSTGIALTGTDINGQYEINTNGLSWVTLELSDFSAGKAQVIATGYDNN
jgi:hypothetical protein